MILFFKVKLSCRINLTIGVTCRQETKHKNQITVKGPKKFENEIFKNKIKYRYTMPHKIFWTLSQHFTNS